jgi:hypothetical protein
MPSPGPRVDALFIQGGRYRRPGPSLAPHGFHLSPPIETSNFKASTLQKSSPQQNATSNKLLWKKQTY